MNKIFAVEKATRIINKYKRRLGDNFDKGDSLALEAMNQELSLLQQEQEEERSKMTLKKGNTGLPIHVNGGDLQSLVTSGAKLAVNNNDSPFKSRVPWMGAAAGVIGNLLMNKQLDLPEYTPEDYNPAKLNPSLVNYGREREQVMSERDLANNMIQGSARGQGSQNALMENILAGQTGTQRIAGEQFGKSLENEGNVNAQIKNQAGQFNAQQAMQATQLNNQNKMYANEIKRENMMINQERKDSQIGGIMDSVTGYARDRMDASQYDNMLQMMTPDNYKATSGQDSKWRRLFGFSPVLLLVATLKL